MVAVLHSRLSAGERHDEWLRLASGEARVCVGPRSAVFAPLADLGLIVVDEEHDTSYKHEGDPRYDARTVAGGRARAHGAVLLCGSATPRPESVTALTRLRLARRVDGRPLPPVEILDMRGQPHPLHPDTSAALAEVRRRGRQGDRAAQPPRLVELPLLPLLRAGLDLPELRRRARAAPRRAARRLPPLRPPRAAPERCRDCGSVRSPATARAPSGSSTSSAPTLGDGGFPVFRLDADCRRPATAPPRSSSASRPRRRACWSAPRWWPRATTSPTSRWASCSTPTRRCASPTSAPRSARSRWSRSSPAAPGAAATGACSCRRWRRDARAIVLAAAHDSDGFLAGELRRRAALGYPPFAHLDPRRLLRAGGRPRRPARRRAVAIARAGCRARGARAGAAVPPARAASAASWSSRRPTRAAVAAVGEAVAQAAALPACAGAHSASTSIRSSRGRRVARGRRADGRGP